MRTLLLALFFLPLCASEPITLHGVVCDETGDFPLANLTIFADSRGTRLTTTDERGRFEVTVDPDKGIVQLLPYRDDIVGKSYLIDPIEFKDKPIRMVMERGLKFVVTVRDEAGRPVPQAKVDWYNSGGAH